MRQSNAGWGTASGAAPGAHATTHESAGSDVVPHSTLSGLTTGDPHTQYALDTDLAAYQLLSGKAVANGYASLDSGGKVPSAQLPASTALAPSYVGTTTIGGTAVANDTLTQYMQKITLAAQSVVLSVEVYCQLNSDGSEILSSAIWLDVAGVPGDVMSIGGNTGATTGILNESSNAHTGPITWVSMPHGILLPAGSYWFGPIFGGNSFWNIYYDVGTDVKSQPGSGFMADGRRYSNVATSRKHSFRMLILS